MVAGFYFMRLEQRQSRKILKIVSAVSVAAFSLFAVVFGIYAWFSATLLTSVSNDSFEVVRVAGGGGIDSVNFIKFEYPKNNITHKYDYSDGKNGEVRRYALEDGVFVDEHGNTTNSMTTYDPAEKIIFGSNFSLFNTNCAALYEITLTTEDYGDYTIDIEGVWNKDTEKRTARDIFLSDCADFCLFTTDDISTPIGINPSTEKPYYYPTYISYSDPSTDMSELENLYYRLSYQQSIKTGNELSHFYPGENETKKETFPLASDVPATFSQGSKTFTLYICVNYAPEQLSDLYRDIYLNDISALFDYYFSFTLTKVVA